ncbi:MAG TPA: hypothetical protein VGQ83_24200 [Polyangia bacterium]|jgi:hypothetical protein
MSATEFEALYVAWLKSATLSADGTRYDYEAEWVEPAGVGLPRTVFSLRVGTWNTWHKSVVIVPGYPPEGPQELEFLEPPEVVTPANRKVPYPLHDPLAWSPGDPGTVTTCRISRGDQQDNRAQVVWELRGPAGASEVTVPQPPSGVDAAALLGAEPLNAWIANWDGDTRAASSSVFLLAPQ